MIVATDPWREADRRYSILTKDEGMVECIGRGARRAGAKLAAHLDGFAVVELEIIRGTRQMTVIGVERRATFPALERSFAGRTAALAACTLLHRAVRPQDHDPRLFPLLHDLFLSLNRTPEIGIVRAHFFAAAFALRLLTIIGYDLALEHCVHCRSTILPLAFRWHDARGGVVCTSCTLTAPHDWFAARPMTEELLALARFARGATYDDLLRLQLRSTDVRALWDCVDGYTQYHVPDAVMAATFLLPDAVQEGRVAVM